MLEVCRKKCQKAGLDSTLYEQFLEQMDLPRKYGFIFIPGGSYGHIYDKTIAAECLRRLRYTSAARGMACAGCQASCLYEQFWKILGEGRTQPR